MTRKENASVPEANRGTEALCLLGGYDISVNSTETARLEYLARFGITSTRAATIAPLCFGEGRSYA